MYHHWENSMIGPCVNDHWVTQSFNILFCIWQRLLVNVHVNAIPIKRCNVVSDMGRSRLNHGRFMPFTASHHSPGSPCLSLQLFVWKFIMYLMYSLDYLFYPRDYSSRPAGPLVSPQWPRTRVLRVTLLYLVSYKVNIINVLVDKFLVIFMMTTHHYLLIHRSSSYGLSQYPALSCCFYIINCLASLYDY